jgi:hypothetical protein
VDYAGDRSGHFRMIECEVSSCLWHAALLTVTRFRVTFLVDTRNACIASKNMEKQPVA